MRTAFDSEQLADPHLKEAAGALRKCVHCGFCTATCPTYVVLGDERDSPRGRITLMQQMLEKGGTPTPETVKHLDRCLTCLGCRTACPSGVDYGALIDASRAHIEKYYTRPVGSRILRWFVLYTLMHPGLFAFLTKMSRIFAPIATRLPGIMGAMARKAPPAQRVTPRHREIVKALSPTRHIVVLRGCVQRALAPAIDWAVARVFGRQNVRVTTLPGADCCGSLAFHMGKISVAKESARRVLQSFERMQAEGTIDAVSISATGCTSFLKEYGKLFADEPEFAARAEAFAAKVKDFVELAEPVAQAPGFVGAEVAYHPACSLQHAQRIHGLGEALLSKAGFRVKAIPEGHLCCGSGGSYNLFHPEISADLRARKLASIQKTGATLVTAGNAGCLTHLSGPETIPMVHIAELLDWAAGGPEPPGITSKS